MSAYLITQVTTDEPERLLPYLRGVIPLVERHGGELVDLVRATETLEGSWPDGAYCALVRFPDRERLQAFWSDPDYDGCAASVTRPRPPPSWPRLPLGRSRSRRREPEAKMPGR
jgi:uncharacterized protein (DUF1330 family)